MQIIPSGPVHWVVTLYPGYVEFCGTPSRFGGSTFTTPDVAMPEGRMEYLAQFRMETRALGHTWEMRTGEVAA